MLSAAVAVAAAHFAVVITLILAFLQQISATNQYFDKSIPDYETHLTAKDFQRARMQRDYVPSKTRIDDSSMYNPDRFEGDIINPGLTSRTVKSFVGEADPTNITGIMRNAVRQTYLMWTDARIPYTISSQYSSYSRSKIAEAIEEYRRLTCIDFAPKSAADQDYIHIVPDDGCYSLVGRVGGKQPVSLGDGCIQKGIIIHELMHAVGFFHEQSRADRDDYVVINWSNVESGLQDQFDKYSLNMINHLGTDYDYGSVMHYAPTAFSKNGKPTIEPKKKGVEIGQRVGFSENDLYKINKLYECPQLEISPPDVPDEEDELEELKKGTTEIHESDGKAKNTIRPFRVTTSKPSTSTKATASPSVCRDKRRDCEFLARSGHCESRYSSKFMEENCAKSCNKCEVKCEDSRSWCQRWANSGMCTQAIFKDYMRLKCAKSCHFC